MLSDYIIVPARKEDAPQIADLMIEAMNRECCAWFYGPGHTLAEWRDFLISLIEREDTQYSYLNALVAVRTSEAEAQSERLVAGTLLSYDGGLLHELRKPFFEGVKDRFGHDVSSIPDETSAGELYYDSLAVRADFRHQGIASALLRAGVGRARELGLPAVGLLVDKGNPKAEHLYRQLGFVYQNDNEWGGHQMRHLVLEA